MIKAIKALGYLVLLLSFYYHGCLANVASPDTPRFDRHNPASLQRGAKVYFNYCAGCHSLQYDTYPNIAAYIGASAIEQHAIRQTMLFDPYSDINQSIHSAMDPIDGQHWFGASPPDLTLIVSQKSALWLYQFLTGFYADPSRPHGTNNVIATNTAMPNVLAPLRGEVQAVYVQHQLDHLITIKAGLLSPLAFNRSMEDLVNFLTVVAEPWQQTRLWLGITICPLIFLLAFICYALFKTSFKKPE